MNNRKTLIKTISGGLLILTLVSCSPGNSGQNPHPINETKKQEVVDYTIAVEFINDYKDFCDEIMLSSDTTLNTRDWINKNGLLSPDFKKQYNSILDSAEKEDPEYGLGFDPIFNAQDYTDGVFEIKEIDSANQLVTVIGKKDGFESILKVTRLGNKTLVDGAGIINIPKNKQRQI